MFFAVRRAFSTQASYHACSAAVFGLLVKSAMHSPNYLRAAALSAFTVSTLFFFTIQPPAYPVLFDEYVLGTVALISLDAPGTVVPLHL